MSNEKPSDEHIIKRVISGDVNIFEDIVKRYTNLVFNIGMRFFKNEDDSNDFVQDVFIKAFRNLKSYKGIAPFRFWLSKVAYNYGLNSIKKKAKETDYTDGADAEESTPEERHIKEEIKNILIKEIRKLPENYRICLDLYFYHGYSYSEISEITEFPVNTIKSHVFRAKQALRDALRGSIAEEYHDV